MRLGMITKYAIGDSFYGMTILNIFYEGYIHNHTTNTYRYHGTSYYVKYEKKLWFLETYQIDTEVEYQKTKCRYIKARTRLIKLMLEKQYEGYKRTVDRSDNRITDSITQEKTT